MLDEKNSLVISRHLISGAIKSIVTSKIAYHTSIDGVFEKGACMELPSGKKLPTNNCRLLYEEKNTEVQTSDLMIKGNLITNKN
ncbi:MAG: hypothetical protein ACD_43C00159G0001 [uncultured bacterium]|nr:MAG: hypothetical protein ACD_43C00159G0001 [uncultured bacterium]